MYRRDRDCFKLLFLPGSARWRVKCWHRWRRWRKVWSAWRKYVAQKKPAARKAWVMTIRSAPRLSSTLRSSANRSGCFFVFFYRSGVNDYSNQWITPLSPSLPFPPFISQSLYACTRIMHMYLGRTYVICILMLGRKMFFNKATFEQKSQEVKFRKEVICPKV